MRGRRTDECAADVCLDGTWSSASEEAAGRSEGIGRRSSRLAVAGAAQPALQHLPSRHLPSHLPSVAAKAGQVTIRARRAGGVEGQETVAAAPTEPGQEERVHVQVRGAGVSAARAALALELALPFSPLFCRTRPAASGTRRMIGAALTLGLKWCGWC
jgi:hypothetical protein